MLYTLCIGLCSFRRVNITDIKAQERYNVIGHIKVFQEWKTINMMLLFQTLTFEHYGFIKGWSGMIYIESNFQTKQSALLMYLQVWRPSEERTIFTLVGSSSLTLTSISGNNDTTKTGYLDFKLDISESEEDEIILFQPKDIVGVYISAGVNRVEVVVITNLKADHEMMMDLMFSTPKLECQVCIHDEEAIMVGPSLPFIFPNHKGISY